MLKVSDNLARISTDINRNLPQWNKSFQHVVSVLNAYHQQHTWKKTWSLQTRWEKEMCTEVLVRGAQRKEPPRQPDRVVSGPGWVGVLRLSLGYNALALVLRIL